MATETATCTVCERHAEAVFRVEGMDCNEEGVIVDARLNPLVGLEAPSADLIGQRLHVKYDAAKLTTSAMVDAVGETGMRMWLGAGEPMGAGRGGAGGAGGRRLGAGVAVEAGGGVRRAARRRGRARRPGPAPGGAPALPRRQ